MHTLALGIGLLLTLSPQGGTVTREIVQSKENFYKATATYLEFTSHPLRTTINPVLAQIAKNRQNLWVNSVKNSLPATPPTAPWEHEIGMEVAYLTPELLSILISRYEYSGGAHPNHGVEAVNFGIVAGKAKRLTIADFFEPGFNYRKHISAKVLAILRRAEGADWVKNGDVKSLDEKMVQRFTVAANGLTWHFNPYDVGPYAAGDFEVKLSVEQLGLKFRKSLLFSKS